ncbi:MAG TPA: membrane protein insertase YidC [Candidatus Binatia bacterium]|nr:membrane protein insertase YidC [Candidatus Binatia bacterium]
MSMERRAIVAAILMAALLVIYQAFFFPPPAEPPPQPTAPAPQAQDAGQAQSGQPAGRVPPPPPPPPARTPAPPPSHSTATIETPLYRAVVSSEGGKVQEWVLHYRGEKPMVEVGEFGPRGLIAGPAGNADVVAMALEPKVVRLGREQPAGEVLLKGEAWPFAITQTLRFQSDSYTVERIIRVENLSRQPVGASVAIAWFVRLESQPTEKFHGQRPTEAVWLSDGSIVRVEDLSTLSAGQHDGQWIALGSTWYLAAIIPRSPGFKLVTASEPGADGRPPTAIVSVQAMPTVGPGEAWEGRVLQYIGPKEYDRLVAYGLEGTLNFGGFPVPKKYGGLPMEWIGVPILRLMNWTYKYVGNYGVAIILLTVISKVLFYPLTVKSIRSMKAMQALQPQVNALRSKYRNDPRKLQEETLALYRKHKVNPMGGCLPMLAQIPVFYALYLALSVSVELQNAPFLCFGRVFGMEIWICDLASPDPTYVLPVLMAVTMFIQQKMTPTTGDPQQARMMLMMPIMFGLMFIIFPIASGLTLYWTVSNILQILQQWYMDRPGRPRREAKQVARA